MKRAKRIGGFKVEIVESVSGGMVWFTASLPDYPSAKVVAASLQDAHERLTQKWDEIKWAYASAGIKPPKPPRNRGNRRALQVIRWLSSRPPLSADVL